MYNTCWGRAYVPRLAGLVARVRVVGGKATVMVAVGKRALQENGESFFQHIFCNKTTAFSIIALAASKPRQG